MDTTVVFLSAFGIYLLCGLAFSVPFLLLGVGRLDPHATHGSWGFRVLIVPGTMFLWPLLAKRWIGGMQKPPDEKNAHRHAARVSLASQREGVPTRRSILSSEAAGEGEKSG